MDSTVPMHSGADMDHALAMVCILRRTPTMLSDSVLVVLPGLYSLLVCFRVAFVKELMASSSHHSLITLAFGIIQLPTMLPIPGCSVYSRTFKLFLGIWPWYLSENLVF